MMILTNTTGRHIGGYHDGALSGLELVKNPVTFILLLVSMNSCGKDVSKFGKAKESKVVLARKTDRVLASHPGEGIE